MLEDDIELTDDPMQPAMLVVALNLYTSLFVEHLNNSLNTVCSGSSLQ